MPAGSVSRHSVSVLVVVLTDVGVGGGVVAGSGVVTGGGVVIGAGDGVVAGIVEGVVGGVVAGVVDGVVAGVVVVTCGIVVAARVFEIRNNNSLQQTATLCLYRLTQYSNLT